MSTTNTLIHEEERAATRFRLERLLRSARWLFLGATVALAGYAIAMIFTKGLVDTAWWAIGFCALLLVLSAIGLFFYRVPWPLIHRRMDEQLRLPDSVLTSGEWRKSNSVAEPWAEMQLRQTLAALRGVDWKKTWPVKWPAYTAAAVAAFLAVLFLIGLQWNTHEQELLAEAAIIQSRIEKPSDQIQALEETIQDWERALEVQPDPELAALLKELQPMREQMKDGRLDEKQALSEINKVQDKITERLNDLEAGSLGKHAAELAEAFAGMEGASEFEAALRRKDFAAAAEAAAARAEALKKAETAMPAADQAEAAAAKLQQAANALGDKHEQTSAAMKDLAENVKKGDKNGSCQSWGSLAASMSNEGKRGQASKGLKIQLMQLGMCKSGQCKGTGTSMPSLCLFKKPGPGGKNAGSSSDPNRFGAATALNSNLKEENLTGTAGEGASEVTTEKSDLPAPEFASAQAATQNFSVYEKLSEEAIEDESLPMAHRQTIKRYFEVIRPNSEDK